MLVAYFDESGTHDHSKVVSICGLVGTAIEWSRLERPWRENLATARVSCFHATDCAMGRREFQGMDRPLRDALSRGLSLALADRELAIIGGAVYRDDWNQCAPKHMKDAYRDPYHLCFALALQQLSEWSDKYAGGDPVALVFARQQQFNAYSEKIHELVNGGEHYRHIGSLSFSRPECLIQLQAADHLSYENYQELYSQRLSGADLTAPARDNLRILTRALPYLSVFYDCDGLRQTGEEIDRDLRDGA